MSMRLFCPLSILYCARIKLINCIYTCTLVQEKQGALDAKTISDFEMETKEQKASISTLRAERTKNSDLIVQQESIINDLQLELRKLQDDSTNEIFDLKTQISALADDVDDKDKQIEHMYDEVRNTNRRAEAVFDELEEHRAAKKVRDDTAKALAEALARKPKYSLKVVAIVVRMTIRMSKAIKPLYKPMFGKYSCPLSVVDPGMSRQDSIPLNDVNSMDMFYPLGHLGRREQMRRVRSLLHGVRDDLAACEDREKGLAVDLLKANKDIERKKYQINKLKDTVAKGQQREGNLADEVDALKKDKKQLESTVLGWQANDEQRLMKITEIMQLLRRTQSQAHLQRDLILQYTRSVTLLQGILYNTNPYLEIDPDKYQEMKLVPIRDISGMDTDDDESRLSTTSMSEVSPKTPKNLEKNEKEESENMNKGREEQEEQEEQEHVSGISEGRRLELSNKLYGGFSSLVAYLKESKANLPLKQFGLNVPGKEVIPVDAPSDNFLQKLKQSSKQVVELFREDRSRIDAQMTAAHEMARTVGDSMKEMRGKLIHNYYTINKNEEKIEKLTEDITIMFMKEQMRVKEEQKRAKKAAKKNLQRAKTMKQLNNRKTTFMSNKKGNMVLPPKTAPSDPSITEGSEGEEEKDHDLTNTSSSRGKSNRREVGKMQTAPELPGGGGGGYGGAVKIEVVDMSFMDEEEAKEAKRKAESEKRQKKEKEESEKLKKLKAATAVGAGPLKASDLKNLDVSDNDSDFDTSDEDDGSEDPNDAIITDMMQQIEQLTNETIQMTSDLETAHSKIDTLERDLAGAYVDRDYSKKELDRALVDYEAAIGRIRVLRTAVEDNYRERQKDISEMKASKLQEEEAEAKRKRRARRHRGTNIACSVCAIRHEGQHWEGKCLFFL